MDVRFQPIGAGTERLTHAVTTAALAVHRALGPGLLESVYEACLCYELRSAGVLVRTQAPVAIHYRGLKMDVDFRADIIVGDAVLVEVKSVERMLPVHGAQVLTYLRLTGLRVGLLINFNVPLIRDGIKRVIL